MGGPANSIVILMGLIAVFCLPIGLLLLFLGIRGKRSGNFPACGSCGFDVTGIASDVAAKCPECGRALGSNVRTGKRQKRLKMIISGLLLLLLVGGYVTVLLRRGGWSALNPYKPPFLLTAEVSLGGGLRTAALLELTNRIVPGQLSTPTINDLVQEALTLQADTKQPWISEYGNFVEAAYASGKVSDSDWKQYVLTTFRSDFEVTSTITAGDPIALVLKAGFARTGFSSNFHGTITASDIKIDGRPVGISDAAFSILHKPNPYANTIQTEKLDSSTLSPGMHELEVTLKATLANDTSISRVDVKKFPITVLPKGAAAHSMKSDPALADQMKRGIKLKKITLTELKPGSAKSDCTFTFANLPIAAAFDLVVKYPDRDGTIKELVVASMATRSMSASASNTASTGGEIAVSSEVLNRLATSGMVEVEIRPNIEIAKAQTNMYEIWGAPIIAQCKVTVNLANPQTNPPPK